MEHPIRVEFVDTTARESELSALVGQVSAAGLRTEVPVHLRFLHVRDYLKQQEPNAGAVSREEVEVNDPAPFDVFYGGDGWDDLDRPQLPADHEMVNRRVLYQGGPNEGCFTLEEVQEIANYAAARQQGQSVVRPALLRDPDRKNSFRREAVRLLEDCWKRMAEGKSVPATDWLDDLKMHLEMTEGAEAAGRFEDEMESKWAPGKWPGDSDSRSKSLRDLRDALLGWDDGGEGWIDRIGRSSNRRPE